MTEQSALDAKIYYYDNDRELPGRVVLYNNNSDDTLHDRNFFAQVSYLNTGWSKLSLRSVAKFNWDATFYHEVDGKYTGVFKDEYYIQREAYVSGSLLYTPVRSVALDYALDYSYNNLSSNGYTIAGPWRHSILQALSAKFNNNRILIIGRLLCSTFVNGVKRGEPVPDRTKLSPAVSVSVRPWSSQLIYLRAAYKNIFRIPTFNESYYYHLGSLSLKPEDTDQVNVGVTWQYGPRGVVSDITATADVYYNHVRDKIVAIPQNMFVWTMTNLDKVRAFGADITINANLELTNLHKLVIASTYSWQRVQPRTSPKDPDYNKQVAYTPQHNGAASVTWQNPWVDIVVKLSGCSDRYGTNSNLPNTRLPGYAELGVSLTREFSLRRHKLDLRLDALNITDTQYQIVSGYPMPGCAFRLTATYKL
ncbi:MAG: outer membrane beta-barrel protein [Muribaculaceae bacterium]|nr:outer membrane beta-barrel protein [Muribaculaceae bacterium]